MVPWHVNKENCMCQHSHYWELPECRKFVHLLPIWIISNALLELTDYYIYAFALLYAKYLQVLVWKCKKYKRRYKKEVELNLPALPECEPMDPNAKPNMSRLCLISSEHLSKTSRPLGKGAFGIVYAVCWFRSFSWISLNRLKDLKDNLLTTPSKKTIIMDGKEE